MYMRGIGNEFWTKKDSNEFAIIFVTKKQFEKCQNTLMEVKSRYVWRNCYSKKCLSDILIFFTYTVKTTFTEWLVAKRNNMNCWTYFVTYSKRVSNPSLFNLYLVFFFNIFINCGIDVTEKLDFHRAIFC